MLSLAGNAFNASQLSVCFLITLDVLGDGMPNNKLELKNLLTKVKDTKLPSSFERSIARSDISQRGGTKEKDPKVVL